jgi:alkanesulfonate monooxygenase SsuD/methylene tetrahydromethanopterin reductase-like flavin-dependent oxidoreductase (luciferase family)
MQTPSGESVTPAVPEIGVYFDLRNPEPWRRPLPRVYGFALEMCEEAERAGIGSAWFTEHHMFDDGYLTQPLTFAAAAAARTRRIRIGTAITIAPFRSAVHIAEEATVVDLVSDGRLELGLGSGYRIPEFDLFDADLSRRFDTTDERVRQIQQLIGSGTLTPAPARVQIPIWLGYGGRQGARRAGRLGVGLLSPSADLVAPYLAGLAEGGFGRSQARMGGAINAFVTDQPDVDWPVVARHLEYQGNSYYRHMVEGTGQPTPRPVNAERRRARGLGATMSNFMLATVAEAGEQLRAFAAGTPIQVFLIYASLGGMSEQMTAEHIASLGRLNRLLSAP